MAKTLSDGAVVNWTPDRLPDLAGKLYVVTGGNSGIGYEAAKILAEKNADVVLACRSRDKAERAALALSSTGAGSVDGVVLNLANLSSVRRVAEEISGKYQKIDALINNAGIMQTPQMTTDDGFELQFGTNHLGHFLLSALLFGLVQKAAGRITNVSSLAHKLGKIHFDDLMLTKNYTPSAAYGQSKLANLLFTFELDRRLKKAGSAVMSNACHPGYASTNLQSTGPTGFLKFIYSITNVVVGQSQRVGAYPTVLAAAGLEAKAGGFYGPQGLGEMRGPAGESSLAPHALDEEAARRLWSESEKLVQFQWPSLS